MRGVYLEKATKTETVRTYLDQTCRGIGKQRELLEVVKETPFKGVVHGGIELVRKIQSKKNPRLVSRNFRMYKRDFHQ